MVPDVLTVRAVSMHTRADAVAATDAIATPLIVPNILPSVIISRIPLHNGSN